MPSRRPAHRRAARPRLAQGPYGPFRPPFDGLLPKRGGAEERAFPGRGSRLPSVHLNTRKHHQPPPTELGSTGRETDMIANRRKAIVPLATLLAAAAVAVGSGATFTST